MATELDEILTGKARAKADEPTTPATEPEKTEPDTEAQATGEDADEATPATQPAAEPQKSATPADPEKIAAKPPPDYVPKAALHDERRKRQELEARLKAMEDAQKAAQPKEPPVGLLDDPEKWEQQLQARVNEEVQRVRLENQAQMIAFLEAQARAAHPDYEEVVTFFAEQAKANPILAQEALAQPNPVEYAYTAGRRLKLLADAGDLDTLLERERQRAREEALAQAKAAAPPQPPESLTEVSGARSAPTRQWSGPKPLGEILSTR